MDSDLIRKESDEFDVVEVLSGICRVSEDCAQDVVTVIAETKKDALSGKQLRDKFIFYLRIEHNNKKCYGNCCQHLCAEIFLFDVVKLKR